MLGLIIALLYLAYRVFAVGASTEAGFVGSATFLYYWYLTWGIVVMALVTIPMLLVTLGLTAGGASLGGRSGLGKVAGALGGVTVGGGFSAFIIFIVGTRVALTVVGAWLLMTAGTATMSFAQFDTAKLAIGGIMLFVSLLMRRSSSGSSSSTSGSKARRSSRRR